MFVVSGGEGVIAGDVGDSLERMHQGELSRVVELVAGDALSLLLYFFFFLFSTIYFVSSMSCCSFW